MGKNQTGRNEDVCGLRYGKALAKYLAGPEAMTMAEIARRVGKSATYIHNIAHGKIVGKETPRREIARVIGLVYEDMIRDPAEADEISKTRPDPVGSADLSGQYQWIIDRMERQIDFLSGEVRRLVEENKALRAASKKKNSAGENGG